MLPIFASTSADPELDDVVSWFRSRPSVEQDFGTAIRQALDEVYDGQRTGRYRIDQLSKVEKTYIGTKVEIIVADVFGLPRGRRMDYLIAGHEVDAKWSMRAGGWMIPREAVGELCLCMTADDERSTFSVGIVRADQQALRPTSNQDKKRYLTDAAVGSIAWIVRDGPLPENLLLHLDPRTREQILAVGASGQQRVNELFRHVRERVVRREVVLTVARQHDGPKRVRDARAHCREDGIVVLGHQNEHPRIARELGLEAPPKGSWISVRLVPDEDGDVEIDGRRWRLASSEDPFVPGPVKY